MPSSVVEFKNLLKNYHKIFSDHVFKSDIIGEKGFPEDFPAKLIRMRTQYEFAREIFEKVAEECQKRSINKSLDIFQAQDFYISSNMFIDGMAYLGINVDSKEFKMLMGELRVKNTFGKKINLEDFDFILNNMPLIFQKKLANQVML